MKTKWTALPLALAFAAALTGCGGKESAAPTADGDASSPPRASSTEMYEDKFRIGKAAGSDGTVSTEGDKFVPGDPIFVSFVVRNPPKDAAVKVVWTRIDDNAKVGEEEKPLPSNGFVAFGVKDTSAWKPGNYRLMKMLNREPANAATWGALGSKDFTVGK